MFRSVLRVKYIHFKTSFLYINPLGKDISTGTYVQLDYGSNKTAYFSTTVLPNIVEVDCLGINSSYAKVLGINENDYVSISEINNVPSLKRIDVQPFTQSDYEILDLLAQNVQSNLLDQLRVVSVGQKIIIWIGSSISVTVLVSETNPVSIGVLDFLTEVVIKPPSNDVNFKEKLSHSKQSVMNNTDLLNFLTNNNHPEQTAELFNQIENELKQNYDLIYRLVPLSELPEYKNQSNTIFDLFKVYILRTGRYKEYFDDSSSNKFFTMTLLNNSNDLEKRVHVEISFLEDLGVSEVVKEAAIADSIFVDCLLLNFMQIDFGAKVSLKPIEIIPKITEIEVKHGKTKISLEKLKNSLMITDSKGKILNANFPLKIAEDFYCSLQFLPNFTEFAICTDDLIKNCSFTMVDEQCVKVEASIYKDTKVNENHLCKLASVNKICRNIEFTLFKKTHCFEDENIIITGKSGMGKSTILSHMADILRKYPYFIYSQTISCKTIKGKAADSLQKLFMDTFNKLIFYQPSLFILDDIHVLCENCGGEESPNTVYFNRISSMICNLLSIIPKNNSIGIIASANTVSKINKSLYRSRGNHLFRNVFAIKELDKDDRLTLLQFFLGKNFKTDNVDYKEFVMKTDGFVIQDIKDFCQKTIFEACKDSCTNEQQATITQTYCEAAFKKSCCLSLQNVKFHSSTTKSFADIGGLHHVKAILTESLLWSVKYPTIFGNAPLRLQSGLLLYGLPGSGKTLLAGAAAKDCGLRLISVKGPELLSKYIGASEQAVRDIFEKAQTAKPCILFFDEFDSLAPRRGHDNTGVTDRVVNQLLTQLDGIESLTGVCVLAATSRPDLLDPALLRPGRLDKQILCPMPDKTERVEIMKIFSKNLELAENVNYEELAMRTEGFTGADLQSVFYTAQMSVLKDADDNIESGNRLIDQAFLLDALNKTNPSISVKERAKYMMIYTEFQYGNTQKFLPGSKVTLA